MCRFKDEQGSTLLLILITVAILTMLGTALLSMSLMNITMKHNEKRIQSTMYLAESGIDQVYGRVGKYVEDGIRYGITETDVKMTALLNDLDLIVNYIDATGHLNPAAHADYTGGIGEKYLNSDFSLNIEALELESDETFKEEFANYLDDKENDLDITKRISYELAHATYKSIDSDGTLNIKINGPIEPFNGTNTFTIRGVESEFVLRNQTRKVVTTDIVITDEITSYPLNTVENRIQLKDNPLWQQALVATKNIEVQGSAKLTVNGNVYGYGETATSVIAGGEKHNAAPTEFGGVIFDGTSETTIDGNLYSRNYVQLAEGSSSKFTLSNGAIYTDTLIAQKNSYGRMTINGNVYTKDDLELNGKTSKVTINGSYYGYTDGSTSRTNTASSAIVINANTKADDVLLTVTGTQPLGRQIHTESDEGVMIGGTGYVDVVIDPSINGRYQMAESLAFRENSLAYTWAFSSAIITDLINETPPLSGRTGPYVSETGSRYAFYSNDALQDDHLSRYLVKDKVKWQSVGANAQLAVGSYEVDDPSNPDVAANTYIAGEAAYDYGSLSEKKAIFATFQDKIDTTDIFVNTGSGKVNVTNYIYTTGLQLNAGKFEYTTANQGVYDNLRVKIKEDYLYQLHKMTTRNNVNIWDTANPNLINDAVIEYVQGGNEPTVDNANVVHKYSKIDESTIAPSFDSGLDEDGVPTVYNINNATTDVLVIYGGSGTNTANEVYLNNQPLTRAIILRAGNIHLNGNINIEGAIISSQSIIIDPGADVTITNVSYNPSASMKEDLARYIYNTNDLLQQFNVATYHSSGSDTVNLSDVEFNSIVTVSDTFDPNNNSVFNYYDWIHFDHWKVAH